MGKNKGHAYIGWPAKSVLLSRKNYRKIKDMHILGGQKKGHAYILGGQQNQFCCHVKTIDGAG
jgi:hypothetical protein